ncbi:MAG TPA: serine hydrolase domain-containing protein [Thermomicrobiales bacterium]|nr:serine hydrolase domain-containing protein [Thermomicrobiales bacterium]
MSANGWQRRIVEEVRERLATAGIAGAAVAVLVDGEMTLAEGIGFRDQAWTQPLERDAQFYIYSITKTLIAAIALRLAERGLVDLDAPARDYLPSLPIERTITARQLLDHTSGLPDYGTLPEYFAAVRERPSEPWTADEFLTRTLPQGMGFEPGEGWQYSNIGYLFVNLLIEQVSGLSLRAAVAEHIAEPLGLRRTFVAETLADAATLTPGWSTLLGSVGWPIDAAPVYHPGWVSHGVVISTAGETARMLDALATGQLLRRRSLTAMLKPVLLPFSHPQFRKPAYGLGVMIDTGSPHGLVFGHGGGGPGYALGALHFRNVAGRRVTSVAFTNRDGADITFELVYALAEAAAST